MSEKTKLPKIPKHMKRIIVDIPNEEFTRLKQTARKMNMPFEIFIEVAICFMGKYGLKEEIKDGILDTVGHVSGKRKWKPVTKLKEISEP